MFKKVPVNKLKGTELLANTGAGHFSVLDFWRYGFSNLNSNILRGVLAEFLVECVLRDGREIDVRNPWGDYDVLAPNGMKIEVKCSSFIQDWDQNNFSRIVWSGLKAKTLYWSSAVSSISRAPAAYKADIYVLALLKHQDPLTLNPLDLAQWSFWVLPKQRLIEITRNGNSVSLSRLEKLKVEPVLFAGLKAAITGEPSQM